MLMHLPWSHHINSDLLIKIHFHLFSLLIGCCYIAPNIFIANAYCICMYYVLFDIYYSQFWLSIFLTVIFNNFKISLKLCLVIKISPLSIPSPRIKMSGIYHFIKKYEEHCFIIIIIPVVAYLFLNLLSSIETSYYL